MKKLISFVLVACMMVVCFAMTAGAAAENVAEGKTYTATISDGDWRTDTFGDGPDGENAKMLNGERNTEDAGSAITAAYAAKNVEIIVDLGQVYDSLTVFSIDHFYYNWGIADMTQVEYFVSENNTDFTSVGTVTKDNAAYIKGSKEDEKVDDEGKVIPIWIGKDYKLSLSEGVKGRYVKLVATTNGYLWGSEIQVFNGEGAPAETSSQAPAETSSTSSSTTPTGDSSMIAVVVIAMIALAGAVVVKKTR